MKEQTNIHLDRRPWVYKSPFLHLTTLRLDSSAVSGSMLWYVRFNFAELNLHLKRLEVMNGYSSINTFTAINQHLHIQYKINTTEEYSAVIVT